MSFPSLGRRSYTVYLPRGFERGHKLPVLVFLQGGGPYAQEFFTQLDVFQALDRAFSDGNVKPFVFAAPDQFMRTEPEASRIYYVTGTTGRFAKWHAFVTREFPRVVWQKVMGNSGERPVVLGVDGISLGGYNAIQYALSSIDTFRVAACMSAAFYGPGVGFADKRLQMQHRYSDADLARVKARVDSGRLTLRLQTSDAKDSRGKPLDSGPSTREVSARWKAAGLPHDLQIDGSDPTPENVKWQLGHKMAYWASFIEDRIRWHAEKFRTVAVP